MKHSLCLFLGMLVLGFSGCSVVTENPVGTEPYRSKSRLWEGTWVGEYAVYYVNADKSQDGLLTVSYVTKETGDYALQTSEVRLRKGKEMIFVNLKSEATPGASANKPPEGWQVLVLKEVSDGYDVYYPAFQQVQELLNKGELKGEQIKSFQRLTGDSATLTELYESGKIPLNKADHLTRQKDPLAAIGVEEITDIDRYGDILESCKPPTYVAHFPESVPDDAKDAQLYFMPGFLQGGTTFQLHVVLPHERVQVLYDQMMKEAMAYCDGGDKMTLVNSAKPPMQRLPGTSFHTSKEHYSFPKTYRTFILEAVPYKTDPVDWNHGFSSGIVINKVSNEVIYFLEDW